MKTPICFYFLVLYYVAPVTTLYCEYPDKFPPTAWMSVPCECYVLSGRVLSACSLVWGSATAFAVSEWDFEALWKYRHWPEYVPRLKRKGRKKYSWISESEKMSISW